MSLKSYPLWLALYYTLRLTKLLIPLNLQGIEDKNLYKLCVHVNPRFSKQKVHKQIIIKRKVKKLTVIV